MPSLRELQAAFLHAVAGDGTVDPTDDLLAEIVAREPLAARERLRIYSRMYGARLVEALAEDYPRVATVLGPERFREVAHAYVSVCPSRHPSLRWFGARFPEYLETVRTEPEYVGHLARLEWARVTVFDAPDAGLLSVEALRRVPPEAWGDLRLHLVPALDLLQVNWPVHAIWDHPAASHTLREPAAIWLRVWRQGDRVYQAPMDPPERVALGHVRAGDDFGTLCEGLAATMEAEEVATVAGALILRWVADELLRDDARP